MFCAISGEIPQEPVVAKTTGLLFEKRLILKALSLEKKCPVTRTDLTEEDLLTIAANTIPPTRTAAPTHVNGLLYTVQQEWDETVLEAFHLRQQLDATRKELANALYQFDAATRVIARLIKERDEAYNLLKNFQLANVNMNNNPLTSSKSNGHPTEGQQQQDDHQMEVESSLSQQPAAAQETQPGISSEIVEELNALCKNLSSGRKQRKPSEFLQTKEKVSQFTEIAHFTPHKQSSIHSVAIKPTEDYESSHDHLILSGGKDKSIILSRLSSSSSKPSVQCKMNGHTAPVRSVAFSPSTSSTVFSGSDDQTVRVWNPSESDHRHHQKHVFNHSSPVTGLAVQPSGNYLVSTTENGSWHFLDIPRGIILQSVNDNNSNSNDIIQYQSCSLHPDGLILGTGTNNGHLKIWDIREQKLVTSLTDSNSSTASAIHSISFSENGYLTASGNANGEVKIWDLRKLACTRSFQMGTNAVNALSFDYSGVYLGIGCFDSTNGGYQLHIKVVKDWSPLHTISDAHNGPITSLAWTTHAQSIVSSSVDHTVRVFGKH